MKMTDSLKQAYNHLPKNENGEEAIASNVTVEMALFEFLRITAVEAIDLKIGPTSRCSDLQPHFKLP